MFAVARLGVLLMTAAAVTAAVVGARRDPADQNSGSRAPLVGGVAPVLSLAGGVLALAVLGWAFLTEDWRFATVVGHARPDVPWTLRVAGIWAGPEGSLLLWTTMLAGAAVVVTRIASSILPGRIIAATTAAYGFVVLTEADPFERLAAPPGAGNGLQPILEHPAMLWHPPVLYVGLIAMLIPTALGVGVSTSSGGETGDTTAIAWTLPLALALLTAGLATGANWAHVELGWGGYWAWDPIENAGLVAWLGGASLLHRFPTMPSPGTDGWHRPAITVVAVVPGIAAIWATTITRTGVLNSVHAFADRPALRLMLLTIALVFTLAMVALAVRARPTTAQRPSRSTARSVAGFVVIGCAMIVVASGTYEPALEQLVSSESFMTSGRFYTLLLWPIAMVGAVCRVRAALRRQAGDESPRVLAAAVGGAVLAMVVVTAATATSGLALAAAGGAVAGSAVFDRAAGRGESGSRVAHLGVGLLMVGVAGTTATVTDTVVALTDAEAVTAVGIVTHRGVDIVESGQTNEAIASVDVTADGGTRTFHPKLVSYPVTGGESVEVDTDRGWAADTQVVLVDAAADRATYRLSRHPRISLVWVGAAVTTIGLTATATARRRRSRRRIGIEPAVI